MKQKDEESVFIDCLTDFEGCAFLVICVNNTYALFNNFRHMCPQLHVDLEYTSISVEFGCLFHKDIFLLIFVEMLSVA